MRLKDHFRPEFLNRLDDIIIFDILSKEAISEIVKIQIEIVRKRSPKKEIKLRCRTLLSRISQRRVTVRNTARVLLNGSSKPR